MRLPKDAHRSRPWRIHEVAGDFDVEDVWALPTPGGPDDFPRLVRLVASFDPAGSASGVVGALFAIRFKAGSLLGWDEDGAGLGARVPSLSERLPADLRGTVDAEAFGDVPFSPLYRTEDEFAAEIANRTVHGVIHLGWVRDGAVHRGQMAILVRRNGLLGAAYMAAILPFRHFLVYPTMLRELERRWQADSPR